MAFIRKRNLILILVFGAVTFVFGLLLRAFGTDVLEPRQVWRPSSYSYSLLGHHAFKKWMESFDIKVATIRRNPGSFARDWPLLLIEPNFDSEEGSPETLRDMLDQAQAIQAPVVLVLPKWEGVGSPLSGWVQAKVPRSLLDVYQVLHSVFGEDSVEQESAMLVRGKPAQTCDNFGKHTEGAKKTAQVSFELTGQFMQPAQWLKPVISCDEGVLLGELLSFGHPTGIYVLSDPDMLNNMGLARADHARLLHAFFTGHLAVRGISIDETMHGFKAQGGLWRRVLSAPLLFTSVHLALLALLLAWSVVIRFGDPEPDPAVLPDGKTLLIDNTARLLNWAQQPRGALERYLRYSIQDVARHHGVAADSKRQSTLDQLEQLSAALGVDCQLRTWLDLASGQIDAKQAAATGQQVFVWRQRMTGNV